MLLFHVLTTCRNIGVTYRDFNVKCSQFNSNNKQIIKQITNVRRKNKNRITILLLIPIKSIKTNATTT